MWLSVVVLPSCIGETTPILIEQCRSSIEALEVYVWKPSYGSPYSGVCDDSKFQTLDQGNPLRPAYVVSPAQGESFELPPLNTGEQLLLRYKRGGDATVCELCQEGPAARGDTPCTLRGPSWCLGEEPTSEPQPEPHLEPTLEPRPETTPEPRPEPAPDASAPDEPAPPEPRTEPGAPDEPAPPEPQPESPPEPSCRTANDCSNGQVCVQGNCRPCQRSSECPKDGNGNQRICANGQCIPGGCLTVDDCKQRECQNGQCRDIWLVCANNQCVKCQTSQQCGPGKVCDLAVEQSEGVCIAGDCVRSRDCSSGRVCTNNKCVACTNDKECSFSRGTTCQSGQCKPAPCKTGADCETYAMACIKNVCTRCSADDDCVPNRRCSIGSCITIFCSAASTCWPYGLACLNRRCDYCTKSSDCGSSARVCLDGRCQPIRCIVTRTNPSGGCVGGALCLNNRCQGCTSSRQCGRLTCRNCNTSPGCGNICATQCPAQCR